MCIRDSAEAALEGMSSQFGAWLDDELQKLEELSLIHI